MGIRVDVRETGKAVVKRVDLVLDTSFAAVLFLTLTARGKGFAVTQVRGKSLVLASRREECEVEVYGLQFPRPVLTVAFTAADEIMVCLAPARKDADATEIYRAACAE